MIIINRVIYYNIDNMSLEFIRNSFYEKPVKDINMMIELNTKKGTFEFVKSLIMKSKAKWSIINFDILFYRYLKSTKENAVNQINHCFILTIEALEQFKSILKEKEAILFIGLDLLSKEFFDKVLVELSYNKMSSVLFVKSQHIKEKLRKMSDFLLMSTQSSKIKDGFLNK